MIHRRFPVLVAACAAVSLLAGCGPDQSTALDTLPAINTTTTTTTTTLAPDERRKFYTVQRGDNINDIARKLQVPAREIVDLNDLPNGGSYLQAGQILEVPVDVVMIDQLPEIADCDCDE